MKSILITGASSGIGAELALLRAQAGDHLTLTARRDYRLRELADKCRELGAASVTTIALDIMSLAANPKIKESLRAGGEPVLINNAGVATFADFVETEWPVWERDLLVNLTAPMRLTRACIPHMLAHGSGLIVNVGSVAARHAFPGSAVYGAAKAGLNHFGNCIRAEYRKSGIRVTNIHPGATNTELWTDPEGRPPAESMLTASAVAESISMLIDLPADRAMEEVHLSPPHGIL